MKTRRDFIVASSAALIGAGFVHRNQSAAGGIQQQKGRSLHVGLNYLDPAAYSGWPGFLRGCVPDANDMAAMAKAAGLGKSVVLLNNDATNKRFVAEMQAAAGDLSSGDFFFLTYSGHGGYLPDPLKIKPSGMSDTWCLYDGEIIDHEIYNLWPAFKKGVRVLVFSDSCHSGTVIRDFIRRQAFLSMSGISQSGELRSELASILSLPDMKDTSSDRPLYSVRGVPDDIQKKILTDHPDYGPKETQAATARKDNKANVQCSVLLLSGCQDDETSGDGPNNGLFTSAVKAAWASLPQTADYQFFFELIKQKLAGQFQHPNYFTTGVPNPEFERQRPLTI